MRKRRIYQIFTTTMACVALMGCASGEQSKETLKTGAEITTEKKANKPVESDKDNATTIESGEIDSSIKENETDENLSEVTTTQNEESSGDTKQQEITSDEEETTSNKQEETTTDGQKITIKNEDSTSATKQEAETTTKKSENITTTTKQETTTTKKQETTRPTTVKPTIKETTTIEETTMVEWLGVEKETIVGEAEPVKYGTVRIPITEKYYDVYSNGNREYAYEYSKYEYDFSGFNSTDDDMKDEAMELADANLAYYEEVLKLVNEIRAEVGVPKLILDETMCDAASMRAVEMTYSNKFAHERPDGRSCFSVLDYFKVNHGACGENIAAGYNSPEAVVRGWKNSPGHYSNMINSNYTKIGIGYMKGSSGNSYGAYWVQVFSD